jgi:hypothetical protein
MDHIAGAKEDMNGFADGDDELGGSEVVFAGGVCGIDAEFVFDAEALYIAFTEGQRATGTDDMQPDKQKSGGKEVISLARYTGRSTMDIVDL